MSSSVSGSSSFTNTIRFSGMASGLDTESIVKQLMAAEKIPYTKLQQKKQLMQWTQDAYRAQSALIIGFQTSYFNLTNPLSNMRSATVYKQFTSTSSNTSVATVTGSASSNVSNHTLTVGKLATTSTLESAQSVSVTSGNNLVNTFSAITFPVTVTAGDAAAIPPVAANNTLTLTLGDNQQTITLSSNTYNSSASLQTEIQAQIDSKFGSGNINVSIGTDNKVSFTPQDKTKTVNILSGSAMNSLGISLNSNIAVSSGVNTFQISLDGGTTYTNVSIPIPASGSYDIKDSTQKAAFISGLQGAIDSSLGSGKVNVVITADNKLVFSPVNSTSSLKINSSIDFNISSLGFNGKDGAELNNKISGSSTLKSLISPATATSNTFNLTINGKAISISADKTVNDLINAVNGSGAGVTMSFNALTGKFKLETKDTGAGSASAFAEGSKLIDDTGLLASMGLYGSSKNLSVGQNSQYILDGITMSSGNNSVVQDGTTYTFTGIGTTSVSLSQNVDGAVAKIKEFVSKYNDLITEVNGKLIDKYDRNYQPLTDDQKSSMSDTDISKWETKAQTGLLNNDSILEGFLNDMRSAISEPTSATKYTMADVGITTGSWYEGGKLNIDEDKLRKALTNDIDGVTKLFTNESSKAYNPTDTSSTAASDRNTRYKENGVITRLYDIINDNVRTTNGKGKLLQKAGLANDTSDTDNVIYKDLTDINTRLTDMNERLTEKETAYYTKFSNLETYMNKMNSQSSWLTAQLSKM